METKLIESVKKALDTLDILAFEDMHGQGMSLKTLSQKTGQKPNTLHGILRTLIYCGYAEQDDKSLYRAGRRCRQIGIINRFQMDPETTRRLNKALRELCDETGESVSFYVLDNGERINYTNYQTRDIIKVDYTMLEENSIYEYPSGRILTAFAAREELEKILSKHGYPGELWNGLRTRRQLEEELERVRSEKVLKRVAKDVASFAAAAFSAEGKLLGTVGVYMPFYRLTKEKEVSIIRKLQCFTERIHGIS